jgi:hypothetical protein
VKLSADLNCPTGIGLAIGANKIVLDLGGHTITGNTSSNGIVVQNYALVTIKNGTVSGFYDDVALQNAPETVISGIEARVAAQNGIVLTSSDLSTLTKVKVVGSQHNGIYIDSDGVSISKSTVSSSLGGSGIDLLGTQDIVTSVSVFASVGSGIVAEGPGEQILKSTVQGTASGSSGIHLINSSFGLVSGTTVTAPGATGSWSTPPSAARSRRTRSPERPEAASTSWPPAAAEPSATRRTGTPSTVSGSRAPRRWPSARTPPI